MTVVDQLPSFGLGMATIGSLANVVGEVLRKRLMLNFRAASVTLAYRSMGTIMLGVVVAIMAFRGASEPILKAGPWFGIVQLSPVTTFIAYITVLTLVLGVATWAHLRAFALSELSTTAPLLTLSPFFTILTGYLVFHDIPAAAKLIGIGLILFGAFAIHLEVLKNGIFAPILAIVRDPGSCWMLLVALLYGIAAPLEKTIVLMSGSWIEAFCYALGTSIMFAIVCLAARDDPRPVVRQAPLVLFGFAISDVIILVTQYYAAAVMPVVINLTIRRAGTIVIVLLGWLIFKERGVTHKLLGCSIMVVGSVLVYGTFALPAAILWAVVGLAILAPASILAARYDDRREAQRRARGVTS